MRWLVADPEDRAVSISPSKDNATIEEIDITTTIRDNTTAKQMFKYLERSSHLVGEKFSKNRRAGQIVIPFHQQNMECTK